MGNGPLINWFLGAKIKADRARDKADIALVVARIWVRAHQDICNVTTTVSIRPGITRRYSGCELCRSLERQRLTGVEHKVETALNVLFCTRELARWQIAAGKGRLSRLT